jgi:nitroimidazol reductase NimA-like FMN-containing flavoprotein (pyridoxamine 5'-phosphate oxidase superfamily)
MEHKIQNSKMRRTAKEMLERSEIVDVIKRSNVCRLGVCKNNIPYVLPVSFGFDDKNIYIHTAPEGRKIEFWTSNPLVCFEFDIDVRTIEHPEKACKWTTTFKSVIGYGTISEMNTDDEKFYALNQIMIHYSDKKWEFSALDMSGMRVWKIEIMEITGKKS